MNRVLDCLLTHQGAEAVGRLLAWWAPVTSPENLLLLHGGRREDFEAIPFPNKVFVADPALRTRDHQREKQSLSGVLQAAAAWLRQPANSGFTHVYLAEYDHLPLVPDLHARLIRRLEDERADVLMHGLQRVDGTGSPHYLYHLSDPEFEPAWRRLSVRTNPRVVLSALGTGTFWRRDAFLRVADHPPGVRVYLELHLPTLAHHLGLRVRDLAEQNACVKPQSDAGTMLEAARARGVWTVHPIKEIPPGARL